MSMKRLFVYASETEAAMAKQHPGFDSDFDVCFVARTNAYTLPKKCKAINATVGDFVFQYDQQFTALFEENEIISATFVAMNNLEGWFWLSHWQHWHLCEQLDGAVPVFVTYDAATPASVYVPLTVSNADQAAMVHGAGVDQVLAAYFDFYVFNYITSSIAYTSIMRNIAGTLLKSKKAAMSLGMYRCLAAFSIFENPRCLHLSVPNLNANGKRIDGPYRFSPYEAVPIKTNLVGKHTYEQPNNLPDHVEFYEVGQSSIAGDPDHENLPNVLPGITDTGFVEMYDPYITCLLSNIPVRRYHEMVKDGVLSIAKQHTVPNASAKTTAGSLTAYFRVLAAQYVLHHTNTDALEASIKAKHVDVSKDTLVLSTLTKKIADCFDYAVLYDRYFTHTLTRYCLPAQAHTYLKARVDYCGDMLPCNTMSLVCPVVDTSNSDSSTGFGWVRIVDASAVLKLPIGGPKPEPDDVTNTDGSVTSDMESAGPGTGLFHVAVPDVPEIGDGTLFLLNVFNVLSVFGYTPTYVYSMIRTMVRKGYLQLSTHGCRVTSYGYAVCQAHDSALHGQGIKKTLKPPKTKKFVSDNGVESEIEGWPDNILPATERLDLLSTQFFDDVLVISRAYSECTSIRPQFEWSKATMDEHLTEAKSLLHDVAENAKVWKGYKVTVKKHSKSMKKTADGKGTKQLRVTYRLRVDRKAKHAWFEARKRRDVFVHAKVTSVYCSARFGTARPAFNIMESKLIPGPASLLKSKVVESPCPECGCICYTYIRHTSDSSRLLLRCVDCHRTMTPVFRVEPHAATIMPAEEQ